ncbi:DoxX family protein [Maribacter sp. Hel_I_7]|uniref:DoxX family protein n=1 Tax=Maribacter sp. Hel_I_7 TaxID=1249997 RepID=UPI00047C5FF9|nr:DoxX family protein [Maribacter sp. Hel_I_7]|tara:strand:+ start:646 stop:1104 length:459 start_codon:yes stop_codon:yes gene_type:complete
MKPLIVLLLSFTISIFIIKIIKKEYDFALSARIAMSIMLLFTAIGHFAFTKGMSMMIPKIIPFKESIIYLTGIFEILLALGLIIPKFQIVSGWALIVFLLLMLPANIYASLNHVNYQKGTFDGNGLIYLWFRIPLQFLFIIWAYISAIRIFE